MTTSVGVSIIPIGNEPPPRVHMTGNDDSIPCVTFGAFPGEAYVALGNHDDPAGYLRAWAQSLIDLADLCDARVTP